MRRILEAVRLSWQAGRLFTALFATLTLVAAFVPIVVAWLTKLVLDAITSGAGIEPIVVLGLVLAATGVVAAVIPHIGHFASQETQRRVGLLAQDRLFAATEKFVGMARFEDPVFLNRMQMAVQHGGTTPGVVLSSALSVVAAVITGLGFLGSLLVVSPWMPVLVLSSAVPILGIELWLAGRRASLFWRLSPIGRREFFFRDLLINTQAAKEIRLFGIGAHLRALMSCQRRKANIENRRLDVRQLGAQALTGIGGAVITGGALIWAVLAAADGRISIGDISLLVAAVGGVQTAGLSLIQSIAQSHQQLLLFDHYLAVLNAEPDLPVAARPTAIAPLKGAIVFDDVWFRYSPEHPWVLRGVSLTIPQGRTVGLIGHNGAGKSTLIKLLCRMYDPERGAIRWDGVDLRDIDPAELRARIGAVFQDYMEYDLTAAENIGLGDLTRLGDRGRITAAATATGAHDFITRLPHSYDTLLSRVFFADADDDPDNDPDDDPDDDPNETGDREIGVCLSGGQWQRLALARAYLRDGRDLMILDEPSSGLDAEAEHQIHRTLREHRQGKTNVLISHRLNTVRDADTLIVLANGKVAEQGTHRQLIARDGIYAELFRTQAEGYVEEAPVSFEEALNLFRRQAGL
ncbi:ABC transporter ATP-binding protein [Thermopolyspora sp. NPDC052614]|uniref:ABC transporter ATP-binding protein n=1 Tax=Thermopolyspora sp. NPDC052614 TaxID=3155682 RepID=UPI0034212F59